MANFDYLDRRSMKYQSSFAIPKSARAVYVHKISRAMYPPLVAIAQSDPFSFTYALADSLARLIAIAGT